MNLIGLVCWFDEPVPALLRCLSALAGHHVDHIVALDGRYALYPAEHDASPADQYAAIILACRKLQIGCTIQQPTGPWEGGEVEKRTALFKLGMAVAEPGDWFWVQDADQVTTNTPDDLKNRLAESQNDVAEVEILDTIAERANQPDWPATFAMRALYRAQSIVVGPAHCMYNAPDGSLLWGYDGDKRMQPALDLTSVVQVAHHPDHRPHDRQHAKLLYYAQRDAAKIERGKCELCTERSTGLQPVRWRITKLGPTADWMECCPTHALSVQAVNDVELRKLGIDPASMVLENRNGRAPARV